MKPLSGADPRRRSATRTGATTPVEVQRASRLPDLPEDAWLARCVRAALGQREGRVEVVVRIVDEAEAATLNARYRGRAGAPNVLAFPFEGPEHLNSPLLGDIVICAPRLESEAREQGKALAAHWAHLVVHGTLHLLGYDHQDATQALVMEAQETRILAELGFADPYAEATER